MNECGRTLRPSGPAASDPTIRSADPDDVPWISRLWEAALPGAWSTHEVARSVSDGPASVWLALDAASQPSGFLVGEDLAGRFEVHALAVSPSCRRRGVGGALLRCAIAAAGRGRCGCIDLEVASDNAAALALYRAHDFVAVGRRPRYYRGGEDALLLSRDLLDEH